MNFFTQYRLNKIFRDKFSDMSLKWFFLNKDVRAHATRSKDKSVQRTSIFLLSILSVWELTYCILYAGQFVHLFYNLRFRRSEIVFVSTVDRLLKASFVC